MFKRARVGSSIYLEQRKVLDDQNAIIDRFNRKSNTRLVDTGKEAPPLASYVISFEGHAGDEDAGPIKFKPTTPAPKNLREQILARGTLPGTYKEIAERLKAEPPSVQNALGKLKKDGKVTYSGGVWNH